MKYSFKNLKADLVSKIQVGIAEYGFTLVKDRDYFRKKMVDVRWSVGLGFVKHKLDFDVTVNVSVGLDKLEILLQEEGVSRGIESYSLGAELGNIAEGKQKRWTIASPNDVYPTSNAILIAFTSIGIPYLEKHSAPENALEVFSGDDKASWLHSPIHEVRAKRALGMAFLYKKRSEFSSLAEKKITFLKNRNDSQLQDFLNFKQKLEARWQT